MKLLILAAALIVALSGCAGVQADVAAYRESARTAIESGETEAFAQLTRADLEEALRSAQVHQDKKAEMCWQSMIDVLDTTGGNGFFTDASKGPISTFQKARNVRRFVTGDGIEDIEIGCAALKEEIKGNVVGIFRLIAGL